MRSVARTCSRLLTVPIAGALAAGLLITSPAASAQPPIVTVEPIVTATQVTADQPSAALARTVEWTARQRTLAKQQARATRIHELRTRIVRVARKQVGDRYSAGSSGPSAFDCSGLTRYVYKVVTGRDLPHYSRAQFAKVKKVSRKNAKPGDLVFFFGGGAHHVGIYIGNGKMVDAAGYGKGVRVSPISGSWWSRTFSGIGRILPA